jgi:hypothetical protein
MILSVVCRHKVLGWGANGVVVGISGRLSDREQ